MNEITKEWLEGRLSTLATKEDLKSELGQLKAELITRIDESQAQLAQMTKRGFDDLTAQLDVRSKVTELEQQMHEVRQELNLT
jgi:hypothetical protein